MMDTIFFYIFAVLTIAGAVLTITRRSAVHSAIWLIVSLVGVAGLYLLQRAEFLFAVQIVLYIGGIMLLFLFVIMLVNLDVAARERQFRKAWWLALACVVGVGAEIAYFLTKGPGAFQFPPGAAAPAAAATSSGWRTRCFRNTFCRLKWHPCCCWWPSSAASSWRRRGSRCCTP